jgi:hypothetical protein
MHSLTRTTIFVFIFSVYLSAQFYRAEPVTNFIFLDKRRPNATSHELHISAGFSYAYISIDFTRGTKTIIELNDKARLELVEAIKKYQRWLKTARDNNVGHIKLITQLSNQKAHIVGTTLKWETEYDLSVAFIRIANKQLNWKSFSEKDIERFVGYGYIYINREQGKDLFWEAMAIGIVQGNTVERISINPSYTDHIIYALEEGYLIARKKYIEKAKKIIANDKLFE